MYIALPICCINPWTCNIKSSVKQMLFTHRIKYPETHNTFGLGTGY